MITEQQLKQIAPNCKIGKELVVVLNQLLPKYNINTPLRLAHFFSQYAHETMGFTRFVENTNYTSPDRLMAVVVGKVARVVEWAAMEAKDLLRCTCNANA